MAENKIGVCGITKETLPLEDLISVQSIRQPVLDLMKKTMPDWTGKGYVSRNQLNIFRHLYIQQLLKDEKGQLTQLDKEVLDRMEKHELITHNVETEMDSQFTLGQRVADKVAEFGGSWTFIISFLTFMAIWIAINLIVLSSKAFDPFPFILLNLVLSCLAALQAPVIMMSQNRQEAKDRNRSEHDYQVNLKAELEIQQLHQKIDHLIQKQGQRQFEILDLQVEMLNHIVDKIDNLEKKQTVNQ